MRIVRSAQLQSRTMNLMFLTAVLFLQVTAQGLGHRETCKDAGAPLSDARDCLDSLFCLAGSALPCMDRTKCTCEAAIPCEADSWRVYCHGCKGKVSRPCVLNNGWLGVCDPRAKCTECATTDFCDSSKPVCLDELFICAECDENEDCADRRNTFCNSATNTCVAATTTTTPNARSTVPVAANTTTTVLSTYAAIATITSTTTKATTAPTTTTTTTPTTTTTTTTPTTPTTPTTTTTTSTTTPTTTTTTSTTTTTTTTTTTPTIITTTTATSTTTTVSTTITTTATSTATSTTATISTTTTIHVTTTTIPATIRSAATSTSTPATTISTATAAATATTTSSGATTTELTTHAASTITTTTSNNTVAKTVTSGTAIRSITITTTALSTGFAGCSSSIGCNGIDISTGAGTRKPTTSFTPTGAAQPRWVTWLIVILAIDAFAFLLCLVGTRIYPNRAADLYCRLAAPMRCFCGKKGNEDTQEGFCEEDPAIANMEGLHANYNISGHKAMLPVPRLPDVGVVATTKTCNRSTPRSDEHHLDMKDGQATTRSSARSAPSANYSMDNAVGTCQNKMPQLGHPRESPTLGIQDVTVRTSSGKELLQPSSDSLNPTVSDRVVPDPFCGVSNEAPIEQKYANDRSDCPPGTSSRHSTTRAGNRR